LQEKLIQTQVPELRRQHQQLQTNLEAAQQFSTALRQTSIAVKLPALKDVNLSALVKNLCSDSETLDIHQLLNRDLMELSPLESQLEKVVGLQKHHNTFVASLFELDVNAGVVRLNLRDQIAQERDKRKTQAERLQKNTDVKRREI